MTSSKGERSIFRVSWIETQPRDVWIKTQKGFVGNPKRSGVIICDVIVGKRKKNINRKSNTKGREWLNESHEPQQGSTSPGWKDSLFYFFKSSFTSGISASSLSGEGS